MKFADCEMMTGYFRRQFVLRITCDEEITLEDVLHTFKTRSPFDGEAPEFKAEVGERYIWLAMKRIGLKGARWS